ncbi:tRNA pseudouridine(55) synthase TruB [Aerococcaceae bacterium WGS1372]
MYNGMLAVYKPKGMTSHDVVFKLRKILKMKKIGHTGTLDPEVEGVLVVCLGKATRLVELLMDSPKVYRGEVTLGFLTETEDAHGQVVESKKVQEPFTTEEIDATMATFEGVIEQTPPMYSAVKVNGKKLYEYAREGLEVQRPRRKAEIYSLKRVNEPKFNEEEGAQTWEFDVHCGKGTYVRTLAVDIGKKLGYPAHMSHLIRKETSGFNEKSAYSLEEIQAYVDKGEVETIIRSIEETIKDLPKIELNTEQYTKIKNGQVLDLNFFNEPIISKTALYYEGNLIAIYHQHPNKKEYIKPYKMFT